MASVRIMVISLVSALMCQAGAWRVAAAEPKPVAGVTSPQPRLAVINKVKGSPLGDLLSDVLSKSGSFDLIERDRIDLILKEQTASALLREGNVKLGRMLKADALLFVELNGSFLHVSLVETGQGERLLDFMSRQSEDTLEGSLRSVRDQVLGLKAKFATPVEKRRYIAMLPCSQEGDEPRWAALRPFSAMIESQLLAFPTIVVVEREHIATVLQEVNLAKEDVSNFSHADYIVRSSFTFPSANRGRLTIQIRSSVSRDQVFSKTFELSKANPFSSVTEIATWIATTAGDGTPARDRAPDEAAAHYENAQVFKERGRPDPFRSLEMAYLLQPTNLTYAAAYAEALSQRWDQTPTFFRRFDYLNLAIDAYMAADPKRAKPPMPIPAFMATVPRTLKKAGLRIAVLPFEERPGDAHKGEGLRGSRVLRKCLEQWPSFNIAPESLTMETAEESGASFTAIADDNNILVELVGQMQVESAFVARIGGEDALTVNVMGLTPSGWMGWDLEGLPGEDIECVAEKIADSLVKNCLVTSDVITPVEHEAFLFCRKRLEDYYRWYCKYDKGIPLIKKRTLYASVCPLFFDSPEKAAAELKKVALMDRFDGSVLENHMFPGMARWDRAQAEAAWRKVLREIAAETPSPLLQLQARRAIWRMDRSKEEALNLVAWAGKESTNLACFTASIPGDDPMWDDLFGIDLRKRVMDFDAWILPIVMGKYPAAQGPRVVDLLAGWLATNANNMIEIKRTADLLGRTLDTCKCADPASYTNLLVHIRDKQPVLTPYVAPHVIPVKVTPVAVVPPPKVAPPPPFTPPEGGTLVFEYSKDVPAALKDNMPEFQGMCFMSEGERAWLAWPSQEFLQNPPRFGRSQIMVAEMDAARKSCRVHGLLLDGAAINYNGASIFRWGDKMCIGDLTHFFVASLSKDDGSLCTNNMVQVMGFPARGQGENRMSLFTVAGDCLYMVAEPTQYFDHCGGSGYSGIFRLKRGMDKVEKVCASDSIEAGPLNDCTPYHVCGVDVADNGNTLFFNLKYGPKAGWWKYEPAGNKWTHVGDHTPKTVVVDKRWQVLNVNGPRVYWVPEAK